MVEENGESGESHRGMMSAKMKEIAREVVCEEIKKCEKGIRNEEKIKNHEEVIDEMKTAIAEGFKELKTQIKELFESRHMDTKEELDETKEKRKWTLEQIVLIVLALMSMATSIWAVLHG
jgi:hypothetical protein